MSQIGILVTRASLPQAKLDLVQKFVRNLISEWRRLELPFRDECFVVAVSGGADSTSLLRAVCELKKRKKLDHRFIVAHFDHGLRPKASKADARFVRDLAAELDVEFVLGQSPISPIGNLEQNARNARYDFLRAVASENNALAVLTGHTINDQAETFLMNLIRGSGPEGLGGMKAVRGFEFRVSGSGSAAKNPKPDTRDPKLKLVRPLLNWAMRADTEAFCREMGSAFRIDAMNSDPRFTRVKIRNQLIPMLSAYNPKIVETLARTARLMPAAESYDIEQNTSLSIKDLLSFDETARRNLIRQWLKARRGSARRLSMEHIAGVERLIQSGKSGRLAQLPGNESVVRSGGKLTWEKNEVEKGVADN